MAKITIDKLAEMVQKGFAGQDKKFDDLKKDLTFIKGQLADVVHQSEFDKLEGRVEYLENILKTSASKK
jgi:hypothetical protein